MIFTLNSKHIKDISNLEAKFNTLFRKDNKKEFLSLPLFSFPKKQQKKETRYVKKYLEACDIGYFLPFCDYKGNPIENENKKIDKFLGYFC